MQENNEIKALLHLLDDPDETVFESVSSKILSFGKEIIPNLEHQWENEVNQDVQERIEMLIHRVHFRDLTEEFEKWLVDDNNLLAGAVIVSKYHYPQLQVNQILKDLEKIRRNVWLELNNYLTPLEKITVFNSIFYNYSKQSGVPMAYDNPDHFLINKVLESKQGNALGNGIVYLILCDLLDIPVSALQIPQQFLLGYFDDFFDITNPALHPAQHISFYIDPISGQMYSLNDVESYFKRINISPEAAYYRPYSNSQIIKLLLQELANCFDNNNNRYKMEELLSLAQKIDS